MNEHCVVLSFTFRAVVATNGGLLIMPKADAMHMAEMLEANYPGAEFYAVEDGKFATSEAIEVASGMPGATRMIFRDGYLLDWSAKSYTDWLEIQIDPTIINWLRPITRRD